MVGEGLGKPRPLPQTKVFHSSGPHAGGNCSSVYAIIYAIKFSTMPPANAAEVHRAQVHPHKDDWNASDFPNTRKISRSGGLSFPETGTPESEASILARHISECKLSNPVIGPVHRRPVTFFFEFTKKPPQQGFTESSHSTTPTADTIIPRRATARPARPHTPCGCDGTPCQYKT